MRTIGYPLLALGIVAACVTCRAHYVGHRRHLAHAPPDQRCLDEIRQCLDNINDAISVATSHEDADRLRDLSTLIDRLDRMENRLAAFTSLTDLPVATPTSDELTARAVARGDAPFWKNYADVLAEDINAWRRVASQATDPQLRLKAWSELVTLYGRAGDIDARFDAYRNIVELAGMHTDVGLNAAQSMAIWEWGYGNLAEASRMFRDIGLTPGIPKTVALECRVRATQLSIASCSPEHVIRLHREFVTDYQNDRDQLVTKRVELVSRQLATYEAGLR